MTSRQSCIAGSVFRLFISGMSVLMWFMGFHEDRSINSVIAATNEGYWVLWLLCFAGVIGVLDVFLNDYATVLKRQPLFTYARTYRHFALALLAFSHTMLAFIAIVKIDSPGAAIYSLWNTFFIVGFSLIDAHQRYADTQKEVKCNPVFN